VSSVISDAVRALIHSRTYHSTALGIDAVATVLLLLLLVELELLRAWDVPWGRAGIRVLGIAIVPLLFSFVLIVVVRALNLR
jgi:hypothetical protein